MKLFSKQCTIIADREANFDVQRFACQHCTKRTMIYIHVDDDNMNTIKFTTKESTESILMQIMNQFSKIFNVRIDNGLIFVTTK